MKYSQVLWVSAIALLFAGCTKDGDTIVNNYGTTDNVAAVKRKPLKVFGLADSAQVIRFSYLNNEAGKLKDFTILFAGVASSKIIILYNSANKAEGYQAYALPANTLSSQGTFKSDSKGRIIEVVQRAVNGDTNGIGNYAYSDLLSDFQPVSYQHYDKAANRTDVYEYYTYDSRGNVTKVSSYRYNGTDPIYKSSETEVSSTTYINGLSNLYYYALANINYAYTSQAPQYFSNYFPSSTREQSYNSAGEPSSVNLANYNAEGDADNHISKVGSNGQSIFFNY